jgi:hypothetical protein
LQHYSIEILQHHSIAALSPGQTMTNAVSVSAVTDGLIGHLNFCQSLKIVFS